LPRRQPFPWSRPPPNDERQIGEPKRRAELLPQPRILGSEMRAIDRRFCRLIVGVPPAAVIGSATSISNLDDAIVGLARPLTEAVI
jgi:hypothetical protein